MEMLRTAVSSLSFDDPAEAEIDRANERRKAARLIAQLPTIVARYDRAAQGLDPVEPDPSLSYAENFLTMLRGETPTEQEARAFDVAMIVHAEHEMNASTFTARVVAGTLADLHSAVVAAICALKGPIHGGANEQAMALFVEEIGAPERAADCRAREVRAEARRVYGFGHPLYVTMDPRATILKRWSRGAVAGRRRAQLVRDHGRGRARGAGSRRGCGRTSISTRARSTATSASRRTCSRRSSSAAVSWARRRTCSSSTPTTRSSGRAPSTSVPSRATTRSPRALEPGRSRRARAGARRGGRRARHRRRSGASGRTRSRAPSRDPDYRVRALAYRAIGQFRYRQKIELLQRGLEDESPACRGSALVSLELLSRDSPGVINQTRRILHELTNDDPNQAVRRLAIVCLKNGPPARETITASRRSRAGGRRGARASGEQRRRSPRS